MKYDTIIIGSGISGLTIAAILGRRGQKVLIIEKNHRPGGALKRFKRQKIAFDVGFHGTGCLGEGQILKKLWNYCGVSSRVAIRPFPDLASDLYHFGNGQEPIHGYFNYTHFEEELCRHFPSERRGVADYLQLVRDICQQTPFYNHELPLTPFLRGFKTELNSLSETITSLTDNPYIQAVLTAPVYLYGAPAELAPLEKHATVVHGYYSGNYSVDGGGQAVVDGFLESLSDAGVELLLSEEVLHIITDDRGVSGVETSSKMTIHGDNVIHTGHPSTVPAMTDTSLLRPAYRKRLSNLENSLSLFAVYGKMSTDVNHDKVCWNNFYKIPLGSDLLPATPVTPASERALIMICSGSRDIKNLQFNQNGVMLLRPAYWQEVEQFHDSSKNNRVAAYEEYKALIASEMIESAEMQWGHLCGKITPLAVGTPLTFRDELSSPQGSAYGVLHGRDQITPDTRTRVPGLFLSGQSTLMTGVVGASLAGLVTAGELIGLEELWDDIRKC